MQFKLFKEDPRLGVGCNSITGILSHYNSVVNNCLIVASCATQVVHYTLYLNTACADT